MLSCSLMRFWTYAFWIAPPRPLSEFRSIMDTDPWRVSALISAIMELILSVVLLLGAAITFITFKLMRFLALETPCTYMGCCHPLHHSRTLHRCETNACLDDGEGYVYLHHHHHHHPYYDADVHYQLSKGIVKSSTLHHHHDPFQNAICLTCHSYDQSSIRSRLSQHTFVKRKTFDMVDVTCESLHEDDLPLFSARSDSESDQWHKSMDRTAEANYMGSCIRGIIDHEYKGSCVIDKDASSHNNVVLRNDFDDEIMDVKFDKNEPEFKGSYVIDKSDDQKYKGSCANDKNVSTNNNETLQSDFDDEIMDENEDLFEIPNLLLGNILIEEQRNAVPIILDTEVEAPKNSGGSFDHLVSRRSLLEPEKSEIKYSNKMEGTGSEVQLGKNAFEDCSDDQVIENIVQHHGSSKEDKICESCNENSGSVLVHITAGKRENGQHQENCEEMMDGRHQEHCEERMNGRHQEHSEERIGQEHTAERMSIQNVIHENCMHAQQSDDSANVALDAFEQCPNERDKKRQAHIEENERKQYSRSFISEQNSGNNVTMSSDVCDVCDSIGSNAEQVEAEYACNAIVSEHSSDNNGTMSSDVCDSIGSDAKEVEANHAFNVVISEHDSDNNLTLSSDVYDSIGPKPEEYPRTVNSVQIGENFVSANDEKPSPLPSSGPKQAEHECLESLKEALEAERAILAALESELEKERNASAVATSEAMAMISRLQEEKSAMQMEVAQIQRMSEEKAEYDEQAMTLLKEILLKREKENLALEKELQIYKEKALVQSADEISYKENRELLHMSSDQDRGAFFLEGNEGSEMSVLLQDHFQPTLNVARLSDEEEEELRIPQTDHEMTKICNHGADKTQSILGRLVSLEEELKQFRLKNELTTETFRPKSQEESPSGFLMSQNKVLSRTAGDSTSFQCVFDMEDNEMGMGGLIVGPLPVQDIYEVQSNPVCDSPSMEEIDGCDENSEFTSRALSDYNRFSHSAKPLSISIGTKPDSVLSFSKGVNGAMGENHHHCPQLKGVILGESKMPDIEEVQSLALRLRALESDRDLLHETLHSFKHRDVELKILQEIALHLQELRSSGFKRFSIDDSDEDLSAMTPRMSVIHAQKKRRYSTMRGRTDVVIAQQKSI